jgi:hypothetical protein
MYFKTNSIEEVYHILQFFIKDYLFLIFDQLIFFIMIKSHYLLSLIYFIILNYFFSNLPSNFSFNNSQNHFLIFFVTFLYPSY